MDTSQLSSTSKASIRRIAFFSVDYQDANQSISALLAHIRSISEAYYSQTDSYYVPYVVISQRSGYGKSRLVKEMAHHTPTIYFCSRKSESTDFPLGFPPDEWFSPAFTLAKSSEELIVYSEFVLLSSLKLMLEFNLDNQTLIDSQVFPPSDFHDTLHKIINPASFSQKELFPIVEQIRSFEMKDLEFPILFVFDETFFLLQKLDHIKTDKPDDIQTLFRAFRRALKLLVVEYDLPFQIFGIFLDTSPKISNFVPVLQSGLSTRSLLLELIPVYYGMETFDCFYKATLATQECQLTVSYLLTRFGCESYYLYGRSIWGSQCMLTISGDGTVKEDKDKFILDLAIGKLSCPRLSRQYLVCFLQRCGWSGKPSFGMTEQLLASHMATLCYVSHSRTTLALTYPSEPILSEAAAHITGTKRGYLIGVKKMLKFVRTSQLNTGSIGELVARLLCLFAVDSARKTKYGNHVSKPVSVLEFLEGLVHSSYHQPILSTISPKIANSVLNFNHFIFRSSKSLFMLGLADPALRRCAAFSCKPLHRGIDLAIPILSEENEPSFIFIQANNTTSTLSTDTLSLCLYKMKPQYAFAQKSFSGRDSFLKLIFSFHPSQSKKCKKESKSKPVFSIPEHVDNLVLSGLEAFNINSELLNIIGSHLSPPEMEELVDIDENFDTHIPLIQD
jgi:hypothetical protein